VSLFGAPGAMDTLLSSTCHRSATLFTSNQRIDGQLAPGSGASSWRWVRATVVVFSTAGTAERHDIGGVAVWVATRLKHTVLNQRIEIEGGTPCALIWFLNIDHGQLVATLSLDNALGHRLTLERRMYTSHTVR
jgi:hypothetical protein